MKITLSQEQEKVDLDLSLLQQEAESLARLAERAKKGTRPWNEVVIHLLDNADMVEINRAIMQHEGATDVITQRYDPLPGEPEELLGELFVDLEWAVQKAPKRKGWSLDQEILLYISHGFDHLNGEDDFTTDQRNRMRRRELRWLKKIPLTPFVRKVIL